MHDETCIEDHMAVVNNDKDNIYANFDTMREIVVDTVRDQ